MSAHDIDGTDRVTTESCHTAAPLTIVNMLDRVVRMHPTAEAAVDGSARLTYAELEDRVRRFTSQLQEQGASRGQPAALLTLPSVMHLVAWLALARLGALPLALHTRESAETLARTCGDFGVTLLIHDASLEQKASQIAHLIGRPLPRVRVRSGAEPAPPDANGAVDARPENYQRADDLPRPSENDPAAILLSSGSTALPKGVIHTHRNMIEAARSAVAMFGRTGPGARGIVPYSTAFTGCYIRWLAFLHGGGCNVFLEHFDLDRYIDLLGRERITHLSLTPTMWRRLLGSSIPGETFASVKRASFSAERMDRATLEEIRRRVTPHVAQGYGSTEVFALATLIEGDEMNGERLLSVGRAFPSTEVRLVQPGDPAGAPVASGETGEIWVNSPSIACGIWRNPDLSKKLFHCDGERRWWRSGDLGRFDEDGFLYIEGRTDDMIISGGINIMPAVIEDALRHHPAVRDVAVAGIYDDEWGEQPHAFVVRADPSINGDDLDAFLRESALSNYQRPRAYHFIEALPQTATGKIDRRAMRASVGKPRNETAKD